MPELLSPAGNFEKLRAALMYGADAVYLAGQSFGMRSQAGNFTVEEIYDAVRLAHSMGKKVYLTLNTMPRTHEYPALYRFLDDIRDAGLDAFIIADLGVLATVKERLPDMEIHISTQASIISPAAARAYAALGAKRLVLARELQFCEIKAIRAALPADVELEAFIHGSMCVSYRHLPPALPLALYAVRGEAPELSDPHRAKRVGHLFHVLPRYVHDRTYPRADGERH